MAIKQATRQEAMQPIKRIREDFKEFVESDLDVVELIGYDDVNPATIRIATRKVCREYDDKIKFVQRNHKYFLIKL